MSASREGLRPQSMAGFSLIELLVVLVILGAVLGAVVLSSAGSLERRLENAARRAQLLVEQACDRASTTGLDVGFRIEPQGLRFGYLRPQGWQPIGDDPAEVLRPRPLAEGIVVQGFRDGAALTDDSAPDQPQFACLSSGELTPFALELGAPSEPARWRLHGDFDGELALTDLARDDGR